VLQETTEAALFAPDRLLKVVLVGNSNVGKSSLLRSFCEGRFHPAATATVGEKRTIVTPLWRMCRRAASVDASTGDGSVTRRHVKGLVKSHRPSRSPGTHCTAD